jgi:hypothetical protein
MSPFNVRCSDDACDANINPSSTRGSASDASQFRNRLSRTASRTAPPLNGKDSRDCQNKSLKIVDIDVKAYLHLERGAPKQAPAGGPRIQAKVQIPPPKILKFLYVR